MRFEGASRFDFSSLLTSLRTFEKLLFSIQDNVEAKNLSKVNEKFPRFMNFELKISFPDCISPFLLMQNFSLQNNVRLQWHLLETFGLFALQCAAQTAN